MRQTAAYNCGSAALMYLLERYGLRFKMDYMDQLVGANPKTGTTRQDLVRVVLGQGLKYHEMSGTTLTELSCFLPAIVNYTYVDRDGHYGVVETFWDGALTIWDPWTGGYMDYPQNDFEKVWHGTAMKDHWFLYIFRSQ